MSGYRKDIPLHPLCTLFPRLEGTEFDALCEDIKVNGCREHIVIYEGKILDGGNRYRACIKAGVSPFFRHLHNCDPVAFVLSANLHRRHLTTGQQATIVSSATNWAMAQKHGGDRKTDQAGLVPLATVGQRAAASGANEKTQRKADRLVREQPDLAQKVVQGKTSLYEATKKTRTPKPNPDVEEKFDPAIYPMETLPEMGLTADQMKAVELNSALEGMVRMTRDHKRVVSDFEEKNRNLEDKVRRLESQVAHLKNCAAETQENNLGMAHELQAYMKTDEDAESAAKEIKRLLGEITVLTATRDQYMAKGNVMEKSLAEKDRQIARLEAKQA